MFIINVPSIGSLLVVKDTARYDVFDRMTTVPTFAINDRFSSAEIVMKHWKMIPYGSIFLCLETWADDLGSIFLLLWENKKFHIASETLLFAMRLGVFENVEIEKFKSG